MITTDLLIGGFCSTACLSKYAHRKCIILFISNPHYVRSQPDIWSQANLKALNAFTERIYGVDKSKALRNAPPSEVSYFRVTSPITVKSRSTAVKSTTRRRYNSMPCNRSKLQEASVEEWFEGTHAHASASIQRISDAPRTRTNDKAQKRNCKETETDLLVFDPDEELRGW